jgi:hypothetical protein
MAYPTAIDAFATAVDDTPPGTGTFEVASDINDVRRAIEFIETELGTTPKDNFQDVRRRLEHFKTWKVTIPAADTVVVAADEAAMVFGTLTVTGTLTVNGELHVAPWP